ncbi:MAG: PIG-L family deacetylase [Gammaproteobacteria bacterium]|nr:PIG-L family deacetylase [Gammaproteobacteria bacterium]
MNKKQVIFLFAHQDDECFAFQIIANELEAERDVWCVYFTDGDAKSKSSQRNVESIRVLTGMGVSDTRILFVGERLGIRDGELLSSLSLCESGMREILSMVQNVGAVYVPAWEGGHPDHDALHFVAATVIEKAGMLDRLFQFSLYNANKLPKPLFRVMSPLENNGDVLKAAIPFAQRWRHACNCFRYPTQWISWFDLFPLAAFSYLSGQQYFQLVGMERLGSRPHEGALYYEVRGLANWDNVKQDLYRFANEEDVNKHPIV